MRMPHHLRQGLRARRGSATHLCPAVQPPVKHALHAVHRRRGSLENASAATAKPKRKSVKAEAAAQALPALYTGFQGM